MEPNTAHQVKESADQRPFAWPVNGANKYPIYDLAAWVSATRMKSGRLCQVFWRETRHVDYRHKNFKKPEVAAAFAKTLMEDGELTLLDIGITPDQPAN
jgi:hypothetical protein